MSLPSTSSSISATRSPVPAFAEAQEIIGRHVSILLQKERPAYKVPLLNALGNVLAEDILADRDFPPFPRSTRDGYALRALETETGEAGRVEPLMISGRVKAGGPLDSALQIGPGQAVEIMTGAPVPPGADCVAMVEFTEEHNGRLHLQLPRPLAAGENIVPQGSEARKGVQLVPAGTRVSYPQIAAAASVGKGEVSIFRRPAIAILATGDEIVELHETPAINEIRNSNSYSLAAQVNLCGGEAIRLPIAPDSRSELSELISRGLTFDLLLLSGGVSMGKYDLVEEVLRELAADFFFTGAMIQPGKPVVFGAARGTYFLGLPGNPISTMVTFELFARPLIAALAGERSFRQPFAQARLKKEIRTKPGLTRFLPARLTGNHSGVDVEVIPWQGSGDIPAVARGDAYIVVPPDREQISAGEHVTVLVRQL